MIILSLIFITIITKTKLELSITTTIISFGISYAIYAVASILTATILSLTTLKGLSYGLSITLMALQSSLQIFVISILFKIKRLKNGMPFLINNGGNNIGVLLSTILLCCMILLTNNQTRLIYVLPIVLVILCSVLTLFWWRKKITQTYKDRLRAEEIKSLQLTINESEQRISYLEQQNEILAKIIHKDNKLIPAMELAVREYINNPLASEESSKKLLDEISTISKERCGIIERHKNSSKKLPLTNVFSIDTLLNYMLNKSFNLGIDFDINLSGSVQFMIDNIISESDLNTLLADIIENAIIATKNAEIKKILISIGIVDNFYSIDVIDSGIPFELETYNKLGTEKATTHKNDGGSGIGMLSTFEMLKKLKASFIIKEFEHNQNLQFTKKISIIFNNSHKYMIDSYRTNEIMFLCNRNDIIFLNSKS